MTKKINTTFRYSGFNGMYDNKMQKILLSDFIIG